MRGEDTSQQGHTKAADQGRGKGREGDTDCLMASGDTDVGVLMAHLACIKVAMMYTSAYRGGAAGGEARARHPRHSDHREGAPGVTREVH